MSSASSTARQDATACTTVQTPQIRWVKAQASRGSRPCMMISIPRNCVDVAQALADPPVLRLRLDPEVPLDPGDRIDDDPGRPCQLPPPGDPVRGRRRSTGPRDHGQLARLPSLADLLHAGGERVRADAAAAPTASAAPIISTRCSTPNPPTSGSRP